MASTSLAATARLSAKPSSALDPTDTITASLLVLAEPGPPRRSRRWPRSGRLPWMTSLPLPSSASSAPVAVSAAKPTRTWPGRRRAPRARPGCRGSGTSSTVERRPGLLQLWLSAATGGPVVRHCGGHHDDVGAERLLRARRQPFRPPFRPPRPRRPPARPRSLEVTSVDLRSPRLQLGRDRVALLARAPVADVAHRVERLARPTGADHGLYPTQSGTGLARLGRGRARQRQLCRATNIAASAATISSGSREATHAEVAARQAPFGRLEHVDASPAQRGDVVLHGRVLPHLGVHRRADEHRGTGGEQGGAQQVGRDPGRVAADQAGRGRRHHDRVGVPAELDVRDGERAPAGGRTARACTDTRPGTRADVFDGTAKSGPARPPGR